MAADVWTVFLWCIFSALAGTPGMMKMKEDEIGRQVVEIAVQIHQEIGCGLREKHGITRIVIRFCEKHRWAPRRSRHPGEGIFLLSISTNSTEKLKFL